MDLRDDDGGTDDEEDDDGPDSEDSAPDTFEDLAARDEADAAKAGARRESTTPSGAGGLGGVGRLGRPLATPLPKEIRNPATTTKRIRT